MQDQYKLVEVGLMIVWMWIMDNGYGFDVDLKMKDQYKLAVFFILLILTLIVTSMLML